MFYKVEERGSINSVINAILYDPEKKQELILKVYDDYDGVINAEWFNATINVEVRKQWHKDFKAIEEGDFVKIIKGRKMLGAIKQVAQIFTFRPNGTYGWSDEVYLRFTDGTKVMKKNCKLA